VPRKENPVGPRLEALLDERDQVRIKIRAAEKEGGMGLALLRRRLLELDHTILKQWSDPGR
jgi:hypothetical protein